MTAASTFGTAFERNMKTAVKLRWIGARKMAYVSHLQQFLGPVALNGPRHLINFGRRISLSEKLAKLGEPVRVRRLLAAPAMFGAVFCAGVAMAGPLDRAPDQPAYRAALPASDAVQQSNLRDPSGIDFTGLLGDQFTTVQPFATRAQTAFGDFAASGYVVNTATPRLLSGVLADGDLNRFELRDFALTAHLTDRVDLNIGYNVDLAGRFNAFDARGSAAYDGLFYSASGVNSPYSSFADGGSFVGATVALADDLHFNIGEAKLGAQNNELETPVYSLTDQLQDHPLDAHREADEKLAGVSWNFAKWGGLGVVASQTKEHNGVLGNVPNTALGLAKDATTNALALSARVGFGDGWVTTVSYGEGITQLNLRPTGAAANTDQLHTRSYGVAVAKHGLFDDKDSLGLAVTRPLQVYEGKVDLSNTDPSDNSLLGSARLPLSTATPETDVELGYVTTFLDGAVALQANAGYQMNLQGQAGANSVTVLSRAKINF
jgi:hypothetical protein